MVQNAAYSSFKQLNHELSDAYEQPRLGLGKVVGEDG